MWRQGVVGVCFLIFMLGQRATAQREQLPEFCLTTSKTTVVVSHFKIKSVDRGSRDVLVQKIAGTDTVLELKAARPDFPETNLTILTGDGVVHMFLVRYDAAPSILLYSIASQTDDASRTGVGARVELTDEDFENLGESILKRPSDRCGKAARSFGAKAIVGGIYIHDQTLFFRIRLKNRSNIGYTISQMNFYVRDKEQARRTAAQALTEVPLSFTGDHQSVGGRSEKEFVVAFQKFTIPDQKLLFIVIKERDGGRLLRLHITNRELLKARVI